MEALAVKHTGYRLPFVTGWGSTETAPTATTVHWASERVGLIGLPFPGVAAQASCRPPRRAAMSCG